jgi:hypothetical protein
LGEGSDEADETSGTTTGGAFAVSDPPHEQIIAEHAAKKKTRPPRLTRRATETFDTIDLRVNCLNKKK